jgi:hypothetical protein
MKILKWSMIAFGLTMCLSGAAHASDLTDDEKSTWFRMMRNYDGNPFFDRDSMTCFEDYSERFVVGGNAPQKSFELKPGAPPVERYCGAILSQKWK